MEQGLEAAVSGGETGAVIRTLLLSDLVGSTKLVETLGDERAFALFGRHDRIARDLLSTHSGREIDKTDGFLMLFERPIDAVLYAQGYHRALAELSAEFSVELSSRVGIHLGEVFLRANSVEDVARGAKPMEVEGLAKPVAARLMSVAMGRQTLLTRSAFDVARRAAVDVTDGSSLQWLAHGHYVFKGVDEPVQVYEAGEAELNPLQPPPDSEKVQRVVGDPTILGWRPAPGQTVPHRANWVLQRKLGEGGFGEVWLAEHTKTRDARVFKFCFEAERLRGLQREVTLFRLLKEALGRRDDIARILDWSFESPPYFLESEFTAGGSLVDWAEACGGIDLVPMEQRILLMAQVADALAAAHSVGILHKDLKPANILVEDDGRGHPQARLTDFGIGMVTDPSKLVSSGVTVLGFTETMLESESSGSGTRLYMAPELLEGRAPSVQADLYALGVMLYQLVMGDLGHALAPGWERDVVDELLREDIAALVQGRPEERLADAGEAARRLRSLEDRRRQRLAEAEERQALERTLRRRKVMRVALGFVTVLAVVMGVQGWRIAKEADRANREATRATREASTAAQVSSFLVDVFDVAEEEGATVTARELLERGAERIRTELAEEPLLQARLLESMGRAYMNLGLYAEASPLLKQSLTARRAELGEDHLDTASSLDSVGVLYSRQGRYDAAETELRRALQIRESALGDSDPLVVESLEHLVQTLHDQGRFADAQPIERRLAALQNDSEGVAAATLDGVAFDVGVELVREVELPAGTTWVFEGPRADLLLAGSKEWVAVVDVTGGREPAQIPLPAGHIAVLPGGRVVVRDGSRLLYRHLFIVDGPLAEQVVFDDLGSEEKVLIRAEGRRVARVSQRRFQVFDVGLEGVRRVLATDEVPQPAHGALEITSEYVAWLDQTDAARVVSLDTGEEIGVFKQWEAGAQVVAVDDLTDTLLVGGWFDEIYVYDLDEPTAMPKVASSPGRTWDMLVVPDHPTIVISKHGRVVLWRADEGVVWEYREPGIDPFIIGRLANGLMLFDGDSGRVLGFSYRSIAVEQRVKLTAAPIWAIASDDGGERVWFGSADGKMHEFQPANGNFVSWDAHSQGVTSALYRQGRIVSASDDRTIAVWDAATREQLHQSEAHGYLVNFLYWDGASDWIWSSSSDGRIKAWQWPELVAGESIDPGRVAKAGFWIDADEGLALIGTWHGTWLEMVREGQAWRTLEEHAMPHRGPGSGVYSVVELGQQRLVVLLGIHPTAVILYDLESRQSWLLNAPEVELGWAAVSGDDSVLLVGTGCVVEYRFERSGDAIRYAARAGFATELEPQGVCQYNSVLGRLVAGTGWGSVVVIDPDDLPSDPICSGVVRIEPSRAD